MRDPVLLSVEPATEIHAVETATSQPPTWLHLLVRRHAGKTYLIAVNDGDGEGEIRFTMPERPERVLIDGKLLSLAAESPSFTDTSPKLVEKIHEIKPWLPGFGRVNQGFAGAILGALVNRIGLGYGRMFKIEH